MLGPSRALNAWLRSGNQSVRKEEKKNMKFTSLLLLAGAFALAFTPAASAADIVDTAIAGNFQTLVTAVKAAGLVETLKGSGPFTVFAPTDEAFAKLPAGTLENLLKPENKAQLRSVLLYHVIPGKLMSEDVVKLSSAKTADGKSIAIKTVGGDVMVNNAHVTKADIPVDNGVIHVIDAVLLPE
jgi:uncharacterized surface protein with fasciclin (FAS1) repeats